MADIFLTKGMHALVPYDEKAMDALGALKMGDVVRVTGITKPRNPRHHRLYWKLASVVCENTDKFEDPEQLHFMLKVAIGHVRQYIDRRGKVYYEPKPTNFASMDQVAFSDYYDRCLKVICTKILPGVDSDQLRSEVEELISTQEMA